MKTHNSSSTFINIIDNLYYKLNYELVLTVRRTVQSVVRCYVPSNTAASFRKILAIPRHRHTHVRTHTCGAYEAEPRQSTTRGRPIDQVVGVSSISKLCFFSHVDPSDAARCGAGPVGWCACPRQVDVNPCLTRVPAIARQKKRTRPLVPAANNQSVLHSFHHPRYKRTP